MSPPESASMFGLSERERKKRLERKKEREFVNCEAEDLSVFFQKTLEHHDMI